MKETKEAQRASLQQFRNLCLQTFFPGGISSRRLVCYQNSWLSCASHAKSEITIPCHFCFKILAAGFLASSLVALALLFTLPSAAGFFIFLSFAFAFALALLCGSAAEG